MAIKHTPGDAAGTREDVVAELSSAAEGWTHFGRDDLSEAASEAASAIADGSTSAQVGHVVYRVEP